MVPYGAQKGSVGPARIRTNCPDEFSVTTERRNDRYGYEILQDAFKGSPSGFKGGPWSISVTTRRIVWRFGDMIEIDMTLCKRVSKVPRGVQHVFALFEP